MKDATPGRTLQVIDEKAFEPVFFEPERKLEFKDRVRPGLAFQHATADGSDIAFRKHKESSGRCGRRAADSNPDAGPRRRLVCIDEFSASMHPDLFAA
jgi:hypothetical protein